MIKAFSHPVFQSKEYHEFRRKQEKYYILHDYKETSINEPPISNQKDNLVVESASSSNHKNEFLNK